MSVVLALSLLSLAGAPWIFDGTCRTHSKRANEAFENYACAARHWREHREHAVWNSGYASASGVGSVAIHAAQFARFLEGWLAEKSDEVGSLVEASSGHWPTGWQTSVHWPAIDYIGVDLLEDIVADNVQLMQELGPEAFGFRSMVFLNGDMLQAPLPSADLLLVRSTLIHWPNWAVKRLLSLSVLSCPPRFKYVMFVENYGPKCVLPGCRHNADGLFGRFRFVDLAASPFNLSVENVFEWHYDGLHVDRGDLLRQPDTPESENWWMRNAEEYKRVQLLKLGHTAPHCR